ncbi:LytR/AlgR family response regulator transcription factor [Marinifilum sp.]|uniref:LytR/AlgR family response regulator transcription factor n=1 Tax=Marinifilum sp. TaxID=2033137 RepID=UPI003BAC7BD5
MTKNGFLIIENKDKINRIKIDTISHIICEDYLLTIVKTDNSHLYCCKSLSSFEVELTKNDFFRVSRNTLVNLRYVVTFYKKPKPIIQMTNKKEISVSRRRVNDFVKKYKLL